MLERAAPGESPDAVRVKELGLRQPLTTLEMTAPQLMAHYYGLSHKRFILSMDKGQGKTVTYLSIALNGEPEHVVITCPTNAMAAQRREILRHFPSYAERFVFVRGTSAQRHRLWRSPGSRIFICTAATFQTDCGGRLLRRGDTRTSESNVPAWVLSTSGFDTHIDDEFHKTLRNRESKRLGQLKKLKAQRLILSSGSPASKGPQDLWAALNLVDPKTWSSYWGYVMRFCIVEEGPFGKQIIGPRNIDAWRNAVAPYIFHRRKDPRDYPPKTRDFLEVDLEPWQKKIHDDLRKALWAFTGDGGMITAQNSLDALYRARLAMICPKALDESFGYGAGIEGIVADAKDSELTHFCISTPFRKPIPYLQRFLESKGYKVWVLSGGLGIDPDRQDQIIKEHQEQGGVIIQTIKYATSYEFLGFSYNYFLGYEYDAEENKQAEDRFQRQSSTMPSYHQYVVHPDTYDEDLINMLVENSNNVNRLMNDRKYWSQILK